ncbi:helix-turn-helix domain-containing protein [Pseudomonas putida LS46]|nr:helix-turn-helix domain-containing protein [Pseudomonas putida LS46]
MDNDPVLALGLQRGAPAGGTAQWQLPPVDEVARLCGFADEAYFSRRFRQIHGQPPGQFRRQQRDPDTPQAAML